MPVLPVPHPELGIVVVIPALAEPDVIATLHSLVASSKPNCAVEVLLVVNAADDAPVDIRETNTQCLADATAWVHNYRDSQIVVHVLDYRDLAAAHAGVGLARKLGMDTALSRLVATPGGCGVIVALDADCRVAPTYLTAIENYFCHEADAVGATIYFEHPLDQTSVSLLPAIIEYELHLRCYKQGLQLAGSPYASHTVGSAMAVRSEIYAQEGGMNRRAAGEDFYFINKLLKRGQVGEINDTMVLPSSRTSRRVPFGTGAAMWRAGSETQTTYAPIVYSELGTLINALEDLARRNQPVPAEFAPFMDVAGFSAWLSKTQANVASPAALGIQLSRWLDGFRSMKFINWLTENRYRRVPVTDAAQAILSMKNIKPSDTPRQLLQQFRELDRS